MMITKESADMKARQAFALLQRTQCLEKLVGGGVIKVRSNGNMGGASGKSPAKEIGNAINAIICAYHGNVLVKQAAARIAYNESEVWVDPGYLPDFKTAVESYQKPAN